VVGLAAGGQIIERAGEGDEVCLVSEVTPFYGESGGQVGDTGIIETQGGARLRVLDTQKPAADVIVHHVRVDSGEIAVGDEVQLKIDAERRQAIRLNHSSTHLLHAALRNHLGSSVQQAGSLVDPQRLRFDFNHDGAVADKALADIEAEVNSMVRANLEVSTDEMSYDDAIASGAMALFGEKYADVVRVVNMGSYSVELCGGTHVDRTGDIGFIQINAESSVAAGVRRSEAVTGAGALGRVRERDALLERIARLLKSSESESVERVERLLTALRDLESRVIEVEQSRSSDVVGQLLEQARDASGVKVIVARIDGVESKAMRGVSDQVRDRIGSGVVVLAAEVDSGVAVTVAVTKDQTDRYHAGKIVKELAQLIDGRGGGKPDFAQAGGKNAAGIAALMEKANELLG